MKQTLNCMQRRKPHRLLVAIGISVAVCVPASSLNAEDPLTSKVEVTIVQSYTGSPLPKPARILVYDFAIDTAHVQVDRSQSIRPRHMIRGDESPEVVAKNASAKFSHRFRRHFLEPGTIVRFHGPNLQKLDMTYEKYSSAVASA